MRVLSCIVLCFVIITSSGQGFRTRFYIPNASEGLARDIFEISPGNYIGAGFASDTSTGLARTQIVLTGLNAQGQVVWTKKHHGGSLEYLTNISVARTFYKQGNFIYYTGCAQDNNNTNGRMFGVFIKYNLNGDTLWRKTYRDSDSLEDIIPQMVTGSVDGGFLLTGSFQHWGNNTNPCLVMKTDKNGNELWRKKINKGTPNVCDGKAIVQDSASRKIVVVGYQYLSGSNMYPHLLILDSVGTKMYQGKFYNDPGADALDLIQGPDKKFFVVGRKSYIHAAEMPKVQRAFILKFDLASPFVPIWLFDSVQTLNNYDVYNSVRVHSNGDIIAGGYVFPIFKPDGVTYSQSGLVQKFTTIDSNGVVKSTRLFNYYHSSEGVQYYQSLNSFDLCSDGGYVAAIGSTKNPGPNPLFFVKYDSTGCDSTLAYCAFVASGTEEFQVSGSRFQVYPNPFDNELYVNDITQQGSDSELSIVDIVGRIIRKIQLNKENKINTSDLIPGVYFLQIKTDKETIVRKIIKAD